MILKLGEADAIEGVDWTKFFFNEEHEFFKKKFGDEKNNINLNSEIVWFETIARYICRRVNFYQN